MTVDLSIEWENLIYRGIESEELDYKAAQNWKELPRAGKAKFVRHCLAMANTKGGYIVVGVGEDASGKPSLYTGLTKEQLRTYDPTAVGNFINKYADPQIDLTIERPVVDGKRYVVFVIRRFSDIPHVCTFGCDNELQQGVFYIRTADAASRPAYRASEIHSIIQRALRNQREILGRMIRGILYEDRQFQEEDALGRFREQRLNSRALFNRRKDNRSEGRIILEISVSPSRYVSKKFSLSELKRAFESSLYMFSENNFIEPGELEHAYFSNISLRCMPDHGRKLWQVFQSGFFHYICEVDGNERTLEYNFLVKLFAEAVFFLGQFYAELGYDNEMLSIGIRLDNVEQVVLSGMPVHVKNKSGGYVSRIPEIKTMLYRTAADLVSGNIEHTVRIIREICERFNMPDGRHLSLASEIRKYLEKRD